MRTDTATPTRLIDYTPYPFTVESVHLSFDLEPSRTIVTTTAVFHRAEGTPSDADLFLDGEALELISIKVDGVALAKERYRIEPNGLTVLGLGSTATLETVVAIDPSANTQLSGLYVSAGRFCTQCEAQGFRRITYWPDRPDVMTMFHVRIEANATAYPTLLSNGNPVAAGILNNNRHFAEWQDPWAKPAYLFALVAGQLDVIKDRFVRVDGRPVDLAIYVDEGAGPRALYAMDALKRSMAWDEKVFGLSYDLDVFNIVAVSDFNFGAMENKGLNIFNSALLLADAQTATDTDFELIEAVVAHEYFHNWSGNRVTCRDWFQLSLKEGLTVFRDQQFSADQRSPAVKRIQDVKRLRARQFQEDAGPLAHPVRPASYVKIDNFYTATIYEKGAEIIRVAMNMLGEEAFLAGCKRYFSQNDGRAATIEDWLLALRGGNDQALAGIETWYSQAGTPTLEVTSSYDTIARAVTVTLKQNTAPTPGQPDKGPVPIPVRMGFLGQDGAPIRVRPPGINRDVDHVAIDFGAPEVSLVFENVLDRPVISSLRGFSAPVRLITDHGLADLALLAAHDDDTFNRWEASQTLARRTLLAAVNKAKDAEALASAMQVVFAHAITGASADPAYAAQLLTLPDVGELMQLEQGHRPVDLARARTALKHRLGTALITQLRTALGLYDHGAAFSPDAVSAGKRAFHAAVLDLLCCADAVGGQAAACDAFGAATNMTDTMAALSALSLNGGAAFDDALTAFEARWSSNGLVMDKWFGVRAAAPSGDPLATVEALRQHPAFTIGNPNRVRAVAAPFALRNPAAFHDAAGSGYRFLARLITDVDLRNPALAASLCKLMESVSLAHADNRAMAASVLDELSTGRTLSANTQEILSKIRSALVD